MIKVSTSGDNDPDLDLFSVVTSPKNYQTEAF